MFMFCIDYVLYFSVVVTEHIAQYYSYIYVCSGRVVCAKEDSVMCLVSCFPVKTMFALSFVFMLHKDLDLHLHPPPVSVP